MRRRTLFMIGLLISLLPFSTVIPARGQSSDAPYIYYYSDKINAFIIERADGTDTRVLGAGLMPPLAPKTLAYIDGPGWSPSGKWFAWDFAQIDDSGHGFEKTTGYLIKADGTPTLILPAGLKNPQMAWAPHSDLLFVVSQYFERPDIPPTNEGYLHTDFYLVDPNANRILVYLKQSVYDKQGDPQPPTPLIDWVDDAHVIVEYDAEPLDANYVATHYFRIFDTRGQTSEKTVVEPLYGGIDYPSLPALSSQSIILYRQNGLLFSENLLSDERRSYGQVPEDVAASVAYWSPDGHHALIIGNNVYALATDTGQFEPVLSPLVPHSSIVEATEPLWSPDGNDALFISGGILYHFVASDHTLEQLPIVGDLANCNCVGWRWKSAAQVLIDLFSADGKTVSLSVYDFAANTHRSTEIMGLDGGPFPWPDVSPDGLHVAYITRSAVIYDTQTHMQKLLPPPARSWGALGNGEVSWHPQSRWVLTFEYGTVASGGSNCCLHIGIVSADGSVQRDLSFIDLLTSAVVGWLPAQVSLNDLPAPITKPLFPSPSKTLKGNDWSFDLSWSPDGKHLLSDGDDETYGAVTLWNVTTGFAIEAFKAMGNDQVAGWGQKGDGVFSPILLPKVDKGWKKVYVLSAHDQRVFAVDSSNNVLYGVYDATTHALIHAIGDINSYFTSASFSPDGRLLAVGGPFQQAQIWDTQTWQVVATLRYPAPAVAFSPDGKWLAASRSWDIDLWSVHDLLAWGKPVF